MFVIHDSPKRPSALIRRAQPADAAEIRNIALWCGIDAWTTEQYLNEIERSDAIIYVATGGSALVGFVSGRVVPSTSNGFDGEIYNVAVSPGSRRKRIGVELLRNALADFVSNQCKSIWLEVRKSNQPAIQFYENNGLQP